MSEDIRIHRGEPDGPLCNHFRDVLIRHVFSLPESKDLKGPQKGDSSRPMTLPEGALFLYAETGAEDKPEPAGSICLIPQRKGSPNFEGLPTELDTVGEVKRMIVLEEHRKKGVAKKLVDAMEQIAREDM